MHRQALKLISPRRCSETGQRQCCRHYARSEELMLEKFVYGWAARWVWLELKNNHWYGRFTECWWYSAHKIKYIYIVLFQLHALACISHKCSIGRGNLVLRIRFDNQCCSFAPVAWYQRYNSFRKIDKIDNNSFFQVGASHAWVPAPRCSRMFCGVHNIHPQVSNQKILINYELIYFVEFLACIR